MASYKYTANGETVELEADENLVAVRFKEPAKHSVRYETATRAGVARFDRRLEVPNEKYTILELGTSPADPKHPQRTAPASAKKKSLDASKQVERVAQVFRHGPARVVATERVLVGLAKSAKPAEVAATVKATAIEKLKEGDNEYVLHLPEAVDPLAIAATLAKRKDVEYAEPDFVSFVPKLARMSKERGAMKLDAFDKQQYAVHITKADEAWTKVRGKKSVRIAILDEGVDTLHEDLKDAIVGAYDAADDDAFQEPNPWDGHGTACAGLAAAVHNTKGVRGIGGGCGILAVRIAHSNQPDGDWVITNSGTARAIDWSWKNGASVLSNSWGGGAPSTMVTRAFDRARKKGRNGKGCVLVIAAGNEASAVTYPATLDDVLCVSASNEYDEPKTKTSHDGEKWWGSNFGKHVAIAAPGVHNYTTDISGTAGYNPGPKDANYIPDFNGTSSATPIVAGAAGLVLSANPKLTEAEVRQILIETADKVGGVVYHPKTKRNDRMGHGRLNVRAAVDKALAMAKRSTSQPRG